MRQFDVKIIGNSKEDLVQGLEHVLDSLRNIPFKELIDDIGELESDDSKVKFGYEYSLSDYEYADIYRNETQKST